MATGVCPKGGRRLEQQPEPQSIAKPVYRPLVKVCLQCEVSSCAFWNETDICILAGAEAAAEVEAGRARQRTEIMIEMAAE